MKIIWQSSSCFALFSLVFSVLVFLPAVSRAQTAEAHPTLAIGATAPDFCLPGIDGQNHCLKEYAAAKILVIAFTCNHCPTAQLYETRIKQLVEDYKDKGVALIAIEPNNPGSVRLDELGWTDVGDSFEDMKIRAAYRHFNFAYLYDGETEKVSNEYGPTATPHVFIFDSERKLRYQGRMDNNTREPLVTRHDARDALDALLAGKPVVEETAPAMGCSIKWMYKEALKNADVAKIEQQPVVVKPVSVDELKALRKNSTDKLLLVDFWATWCGPCREELPQFETMYRMYSPRRSFDLVTVSINYPDEIPGVLKVLQGEHATSTNYIMGSTDIYSQLAAFDPKWNAAVPYTLLIRPNGEVVYSSTGTVDAMQLKREILANVGDNDYIGHEAYWKTALEAAK
jgi:thiol-disulfide isomerase/thioredoxin